jgi:hypothetical protein
MRSVQRAVDKLKEALRPLGIEPTLETREIDTPNSTNNVARAPGVCGTGVVVSKGRRIRWAINVAKFGSRTRFILFVASSSIWLSTSASLPKATYFLRFFRSFASDTSERCENPPRLSGRRTA